MGYCVMRFSNEEVINETDEVIRQIESYFSR
jgi:very-short-patch-repair endonuclease